MNTKQFFALAALVSLIILCTPLLSSATFSIVAVDPITGEVGSAGASCVAGVKIISDLHPGVGGINTQAYYIPANQENARILMDKGLSPASILDWIVENDAQNNPTMRQYGVADLVDGGRSAAYTGSNCNEWKGHIEGPTYAIQGNILLNSEILSDMETAFLETGGSLAERLMATLQAANIPGADSRCLASGKPALSAYLQVAQAEDPWDDIYLELNVDDTVFYENPIDLLQEQFDVWLLSEVPDYYLNSGWLGQNHPNPFNPSTEIVFQMMRTGRVSILIMDLAGRRIATLLNEDRSPGHYSVFWNGCNDDGMRQASGVFLYQLKLSDYEETRKMVLLE